MNESTELALVPPAETALQVFQVVGGLDPWVSQIRAEVDKFQAALPGLATIKDRALYASMAHKIARSKTALDAVGKSLSAAQKEVPKKIDAERKRVWGLLEVWQKEVRQPLDDWQAAEDARVDEHQAGLEHLGKASTEGASAAMIKSLIQDLDEVAIGDDWQEFEAEARQVKAASIATMTAALVIQEKHEAEQAELERLRAEFEARSKQDEHDRIAKAAAESATREAEQRAQAERDASAQRERDAAAAARQRETDLQLQAERAERLAEQAERNRIASEQQAAQDKADAERRQAEAVERAAQAERQRHTDEQARIQREAKVREANVAHKTKINRAALEAFIAEGMPAECAKQAVILIAQRKIPSVTIAY